MQNTFVVTIVLALISVFQEILQGSREKARLFKTLNFFEKA